MVKWKKSYPWTFNNCIIILCLVCTDLLFICFEINTSILYTLLRQVLENCWIIGLDYKWSYMYMTKDKEKIVLYSTNRTAEDMSKMAPQPIIMNA